MKRTKLLSRAIAALSGSVILLTSLSFSISPQVVWAEDDTSSESRNSISSLTTVTALQWVENSSATISWTASAEANYYAVTVDVYKSDGTAFIGSTTTGTTATELDVQQEIHSIIGEAEYDVVKVRTAVVAQEKQDDIVVAESDEVLTGLWEYQTSSQIQIPTPTNVSLTDDYTAVFDYEIENPEENIGSVYIDVWFNGSNYAISYPTTVIWDNGTCRADIEAAIARLYKHYSLEGEADVAYRVSLEAIGEGYSNSEYSVLSNYVKYDGLKEVDSIVIAPRTPIICKGNSYYLGKTIEPVDAYYENISWSSEDTSVVTVDSEGKITGVEVGTSNVTAAVGDVSDTVPITVYEIKSNITNEEDKEEIIDAAEDIIDDIANNENPDISNTDIDENDLDELQQEITDAAQNGAEFWVNFKDKGRGLGHYQEYWEDPAFWAWYQEKYGTDNGWHLGWGKDVVYEMGYTDSNGQDHTIGNITEFDKEYGFEFEIPDDAEIEELKNGKKRIYNVIRIHDGQFEVVDVEVDKNGKIKVLSDKYSDFLLLYQDVDVADECNVLNAANITLGGELGLNFYVTVPDEVTAAGAMAVMNGPNGEKSVELSTLTKDAKGRYMVTYKIKAVDIDKKVLLKLTDNSGNTLDLIKESGDALDGNTIEYGICDYIASAKASNSISDSDMNIINAMYTYGAYSAKWKYGTALPNDVNHDLPVLNKADFEKYALKQDGTNETITLTGASLVLDSNTAFRLYFTVFDDIADHSIMLESNHLTPHETGTIGKYYVDIENIGAGNLKTDYTVLFDRSYTVTVSAMTYVYNYLKSGMNDENLLNLLKAICAYSDVVDAVNKKEGK